MNVSPSSRCVDPAGDQALDGGVDLVGRHAAEERLADLGLGPEAAAHEDVVRLPPHAALVARRRALEAKVADPVLCARVGTTVEVEPKVGDLVAELRLEVVDQTAEARLGLGDREVAVRLAGAGDRVPAHRVDVEREADALELGHRLVDRLVRDAGDDEVLLAREPDVAAVALGEIGDRDHLVAADEAEVHRHADVGETFLLLRVHAHVVRRLDRDRRELVVLELLAELRLDALADAFGADVVDHELEPGLHARDAVLEVLRPHRGDRAEDLVRVLLGDEDAHVLRDPRHGREAAADVHREALAAVVVTVPISEMQLISGALQRSAHAAIEYLCLRGRSAQSGLP